MTSEQLELVPQPPKLSTCRTCRAPIIWVRTERGKKMPLDANPVDDQTQASLFVLRDIRSYEGPLAIAAWGLVELEPHYKSHFATCEQNQAQQPPQQPPQDPGRRHAGRKYRTTKR